MKYYLKNYYNDSLQIRNTQMRLIRYIRSWNIRHPDKPILRRDIREIGRIQSKPLIWYKRWLRAWAEFFGLKLPFSDFTGANKAYLRDLREKGSGKNIDKNIDIVEEL